MIPSSRLPKISGAAGQHSSETLKEIGMSRTSKMSV